MERPYTDKELDDYIKETYSWINEHPTVLMKLVAKWIEEKYKNNKNEQ